MVIEYITFLSFFIAVLLFQSVRGAQGGYYRVQSSNFINYIFTFSNECFCACFAIIYNILEEKNLIQNVTSVTVKIVLVISHICVFVGSHKTLGM